jgi:hypothetical protein
MGRRGLIALAVAMIAAAPVVAAPLDIRGFRDRVAAAWQARSGKPVTIFDDGAFTGTMPDGSDVRVNVDNAYDRYRADPTALDAVIDSFVTTLSATFDDSGGGLDQLVIIIRPADYLVRTLGQKQNMENFLPAEPLAGDLAQFLAVDSVQALRTASTDDLARWKIDLPTAWSRARANIRVRIGPIAMFRLGDERGAAGMSAESGLAPSLLATDEFCSRKAPRGIDGQVVLLLSRDDFLFGIPSDRAGMTHFWEATAKLINGKGSLSATPITCREGKWVTVPLPRAPAEQ